MSFNYSNNPLSCYIKGTNAVRQRSSLCLQPNQACQQIFPCFFHSAIAFNRTISGMSTQVFFHSLKGSLKGSKVKMRGHILHTEPPLSSRSKRRKANQGQGAGQGTQNRQSQHQQHQRQGGSGSAQGTNARKNRRPKKMSKGQAGSNPPQASKVARTGGGGQGQ